MFFIGIGGLALDFELISGRALRAVHCRNKKGSLN
nr:MAG TPA: hypothetical protein [Microviridae sp.]